MGAEGSVSVVVKNFTVVPTHEWNTPAHLAVQSSPEIGSVIRRLTEESGNCEHVTTIFLSKEKPVARLPPEIILGVIGSLPNNNWFNLGDDESLIIPVKFPEDSTDAGYFHITPTLGTHTPTRERNLYMSWRGHCHNNRRCCHDMVEAQFFTL